MYIIDDSTIIIQKNDHTSLEVRGMYISDDPTIRLHFAKLKKIDSISHVSNIHTCWECMEKLKLTSNLN